MRLKNIVKELCMILVTASLCLQCFLLDLLGMITQEWIAFLLYKNEK